MPKRDQRGIAPPSTAAKPITGKPDTSVPGKRGIVEQPGAAEEDNRSTVHQGKAVQEMFAGGTSEKTAEDAKE